MCNPKHVCVGISILEQHLFFFLRLCLLVSLIAFFLHLLLFALNKKILLACLKIIEQDISRKTARP